MVNDIIISGFFFKFRTSLHKQEYISDIMIHEVVKSK